MCALNVVKGMRLFMKKVWQAGGVILLFLFSLYYTEKVVDVLREKDPIMQTIRKEEHKYYEEAVDAVLTDNSIVPGAKGSKVNVDESYKKMKQYGSYKESLLVFEEVDPSVSLDDYYDRYIESGNGLDGSVSLVFKVEREDSIDSLLTILETSGEKATFFVDGLWLENNQELVSNMTSLGHEVEVMHYNGTYDEVYFTSAIQILNSITTQNKNYCYAEYDQKEVLDLCSKLGLHTIIPTLQVKNKPYMEVKKKVSDGSIISMKVDGNTEAELEMVLKYLNQKGYTLSSLDSLLTEK